MYIDMMYLGTSGFSYDDWTGPFYPPAMPKKDRLIYYAREFNACEINSTYYAIPSIKSIESMCNKVPEGFQFSVKASKEMTHERQGDWQVFEAFQHILAPMMEQGKLGCVLAQFPSSFHSNAENRGYLASFKEHLKDLPVVVEFRNARWLRDDVFGWMRENGLGFCCVDEPQLPNLLPPVTEITSDIAYVRFHGRNREKWWNHEHAYERYDYTYSREELVEWLPKIRSLNERAGKVFLFANNHWRGQAIDTIRQMRLMLDE